MISRRSLAQFDFFVLGLTALLAGIGALGVFSASGLDFASPLFTKQLIRIGLGIALCLVLAFSDYHFLTDHAPLLYGLAIAVLIGVLFFGTEINGSKSWIVLAGVNLQPSEFTKIVMILTASWFLADSSENYLGLDRLVKLGILTGIPVALIILQRDLGTAIMYLPMVGGMAWVAGIRGKVILVVVLIALMLGPVVWYGMKDYQKQRVLVTLDPGLDPQGIGYQTRQAQIAIGSGGLLGRGLGSGLQSQLGFVPYSHTDFIYALLAEELGLFGAAGILLLYVLLLMQLLRIAQNARDRNGLFLISGVVCLIIGHLVVNIGMVLGLMPAVGIPLPLLSYGGSSLLTIFAAIGLALSVGMRRFFYS